MISMLKARLLLGSFLLSPLLFVAPVTHAAEQPAPPEEKPECSVKPGATPDLPRAETYKGLPFQPGEEVRYVLKYGALRVHVGYGFLRVQPPTKQVISTLGPDRKIIQESRWHRVFSAEAYTGDWYKLIFAGKDSLQSIARPWDWSPTKFYINQNEEKPFVRRYNAEKWLEFDHSNCAVKQRFVDHKKKEEKNTESFIEPQATDAMSAAYRLRTFDYKINKTERFMVYTSEKNWFLEATPIAEETLTTSIGTFKAHKLEVKTYLGKELQQRGNLYVWVAIDHPNHPILRIQGEVTFGSIYTEIDQFTPGVPLDGSPVPVPPATPAVAPTTAPGASPSSPAAVPSSTPGKPVEIPAPAAKTPLAPATKAAAPKPAGSKK